MKNLLYKEIKLCMNSQTVIFMLLSCLIIIPSWPSLVSFIYTFVAVFMIIPLSVSNRDLEYTANLPIRKKDVVKGKVLLFGLVEVVSLVISIPFALIKAFLITPNLDPSTTYSDLGVNFALYGFALLMMALFNIVFIPWAYKKPNKILIPELVSTLIVTILLGAIMILFIAIPSWSAYINTFTGINLVVQLSILAGGIILFILSLFFANYFGGKNFQKIDL